MTLQPEKQTFLIKILPNISRSKGNQTMKFSQLKQCNIRNIFHEKSCKRCGRETITRPFSKNLKLSTFLDQYFKVSFSLLSLLAKLMAIEIY